MKEVMHYVCEVCGTEYDNKYECARCEKGHRMPVKFIGSKYQPITINALGIPDVISIEFDNGEVYGYHRNT